MRRQGLARCNAAVSVLFVLFVLSGCDSSDPQVAPSPSSSPSGSSTSTPSPTPTPGSSASSAAAPAHKAGTCLGPKPGNPNTKVPVACTQPHEIEIAAPLRTKASSYAVANAEAEQMCRAAGTTYLGSPYHASTRLRVDPGLPSKESWAKGQRAGSCLVQIHTADLDSFATRRGSIRNALAGEGLHRYRLCGVDKANASGRFQYTGCDRPHRSEALPFTVVAGVATDPYPGRQVLNRRIGPQCRAALREFLGTSARRTDIEAGWRMPSQTQWGTGSRTATCYADLDIPVRKTTRALATRPLSTLR